MKSGADGLDATPGKPHAHRYITEATQSNVELRSCSPWSKTVSLKRHSLTQDESNQASREQQKQLDTGTVNNHP